MDRLVFHVLIPSTLGAVASVKKTRITERTGLQFHADFFNIFNWHMFNPTSYWFGDQAFDTDVASDFLLTTGGNCFLLNLIGSFQRAVEDRPATKLKLGWRFRPREIFFPKSL